MVSERIATAGFQKLEEAFAQRKELREGSLLLGGISAAFDRMGGFTKVFADVVEQGHKDAVAPSNKRLRFDWAKLDVQMAALFDAKNAETMDMSGVDEDDLRATVTEIAIRLLASDTKFLAACVEETLKRDPDLLQRLTDDQMLGDEELEPALLEECDV